MKESITKFDLEAAFKALDEIEAPISEEGLKANKPALTEIFSRKSKFDALFEEYYDIGSTEELSDAKEAREAEVAKAKLARIEKIVDLDAETPDELLASYVGKLIIQCPQCMTLFYKNPEDVEESEDDAETVNVNEVCQHCGNESGYTLIGKVGEASAEDNFTETEQTDPEELSVEADAADSEEESDEDLADLEGEDFDLDSELEEIDLEIEDDEEEKKEESFSVADSSTNLLVEQLTEESELDVSAEDFEKLINSSEFKQPITDRAARAMMQEFDETGEEVKKNLKESIEDSSSKEDDKTGQEEPLEEGVFDKIKDKFAKAIDKITSSIKSREAKADWIRDNARDDYDNIKISDAGKLVPDEKNQRFHTFIIIGFKDKYSNGKLITKAPSFSNKDLVVGKNGVQVQKHYENADSIAKGWSLRQGNGPAFIYLAKDENDSEAVFLCEYFKGELEYDQLEKYFEIIKKDLEASKLMAKGGMNQNSEEDDNSSQVDESPVEDYEIISASQVKPGMRIEDTKYAFTIDGKKVNLYGEVVKCVKIPADQVKDDANISICVRFDSNNKTYSIPFAPNQKILIKLEENLHKIMSGLEELQESTLEKLIADSLIKNSEDIAGFRLKNCSYLNEQFIIEGKLLLASGKTENTTYTFSEAYIRKDDTIAFRGLNESLSLNKYFTLIGHANAEKTFIVESFSCRDK